MSAMECFTCLAVFDSSEMPLGGRIIECPKCHGISVLPFRAPGDDDDR
jgi:hypothetical protein